MNDWKPRRYDEHARFVSDYGHAVVDLLAPKPGERILDLGCGDGALTLDIMKRRATVVGVDRSAEMVRAAITRGVDARLTSGDALAFDREVDAVFTNAAPHWILDADSVIKGVAKALRPGACRGYSPWFFPTPENYTKRLEGGGFRVEDIALIPRPTLLPTHMAGWLQTFAGPFFARCDAADIPEITEDAVALLRPALCDDQGVWTADYMRLGFTATLR